MPSSPGRSMFLAHPEPLLCERCLHGLKMTPEGGRPLECGECTPRWGAGNFEHRTPFVSMWRTGWKVVCPDGDNTYFSAICSFPLGVRYSHRAVTKRRPGDGPLAVFTTWGAANNAMDQGHEIHRVVYKKSADRELWVRVEGRTVRCRWALPEGTDFADEVILS